MMINNHAIDSDDQINRSVLTFNLFVNSVRLSKFVLFAVSVLPLQNSVYIIVLTAKLFLSSKVIRL